MKAMKRETRLNWVHVRGRSVLAWAALLTAGCAPAVPDPQVEGRLVFSGLSAALLSITGTSPDNVYAVGADPQSQTGPYVLHYDGQAWERLETGTNGDLWWISQTPIGGAYFMSGEGGTILRFDPASGEFSAFDTPGDDTVFGVWGADAANVWAVGGDLANEDAGGFIWRYDGNTWTVEDVSALVPEGLPTLYKVWGRGAADVYVVGRLGLVLHFDGGAWSRIPTDTTRTLFTVHGDGAQVIAVGGFGDAVIEELEGDAFVNRAPQNTAQLNGVSVPSSGQAVAAGNGGLIVRRTAAGWQEVTTDFDTQYDFHAAWVDPEGGIWAVGGNLSSALDEGMIAYVGPRAITDTVRE